MALAGELRPGSCDLAQRFLQTAVVVDDEAYMPLAGGDRPQAGLVAPDRRAQASSQNSQGAVYRDPIHTLNAGSIMDAFSALGVICGVVSPTDSAMETMRRADIVIFDWLLEDGKPQRAMELIRDLLTEEADRNSLRLLAIYTGEAGLEEVAAAVTKVLTEVRLDPEVDDTKTTISYRHGCVVLYAKSDVNLAEHLKCRSVAEKDLPAKLVEDFASMTAGLLPAIALTSLATVREASHRLLDQFSANLDPAFLAHRACLPNPEDGEQQLVKHVAEELRGLIDNAVAEAAPAGAVAVERWVRTSDRRGEGFVFGGQTLDLDQTIKLANSGLDASSLSKNAFKDLTSGFAGKEAVGLDEHLAWIMSYRTVHNAPLPILWLGSVVTELSEDIEPDLICIRPRCDSVRLEQDTAFFFLPLVEPHRGMEQIVVKFNGTFKRLGIELDSASWIRRQFKPSAINGPVTATQKKSGGGFEFTDTCGKRYTWRGELKSEFAQRIAQNAAAPLARVAVDESEWLRRITRKG